jgi:hypothetical protein
VSTVEVIVNDGCRATEVGHFRDGRGTCCCWTTICELPDVVWLECSAKFPFFSG